MPSTRHGAKQYYIDINVAICFTQIFKYIEMKNTSPAELSDFYHL